MKEYADSGKVYRKSTPIHVRGALMYNHMLKQKQLENKYQPINEGDRIKFIYLREPNTLHEDVISFTTEIPKEFDLDKYVDYEKQFNKVFLDPLASIMGAISWTIEDEATLDDFFA
jgi:DNA polymerase elongation subunit (family B)